MFDSNEERRHFRRYRKDTEIIVKLGAQKYACKILDYSADGICLHFTESAPTMPDKTIIDVRIEDPEIDFLGEVVWTKPGDPGMIAGFKRLGNIKGTCHDFRLADLLIGLQRSEKTGVFEVISGARRSQIHIKNGDMVFASSNQEDDRFGEVLLKGGKITLAQYLEAGERLKKTGKRLGTVLIELGFLKPNELVWAVRNQVVEIIVNLLTMECGYFEFKEGSLPSEETITLKLSAANLIYRGVKRITNFQFIIQDFPSLETRLSLSRDPMDLFQDIAIEEEDKPLLSLISGGKTIREILAESPLSDFKNIKAIYALLSARIVTVGRRGDKPSGVSHEDVISKPLADADPEFEKLIDEVHAKLGSAGFYGILGIAKTASGNEIRKAYFSMAKEFHPDRHFSIRSEDTKKKLNDILASVTEAYHVLSNPTKRMQYDTAATASHGEPAAKKADSKDEKAKEAFSEGRSKMLLGLYEEAEKLFAQAIYLDRSDASFHYYHGLALNRMMLFEDAARAFQDAIRLDPNKSNYHAALGHAFISLGFPKRAKGSFEKSLELAPDNDLALDGMRKVEESV